MIKNFFYSHKTNLLLWFGVFFIVLFAYRNTFDNEFHFDDAHTIQNNYYITDIKNIPDFFGKDGSKMFSSVPSNQVYRPLVTTQVAFSYWLSKQFTKNDAVKNEGNGFDTFYYRLIIMVEFLILLILFYLFSKKIFEKFIEKEDLKIVTFLVVAWFGVHTVNAETLNYIISFSDLMSTFWVVAAFVVYQYFPKIRIYGVYLIPFVLAILTKQTSVVFLPMLFIYILFFELPNKLKNTQTSKEKRRIIINYGFELMATFIVTIAGMILVIKMQSETYNPGGASRWLYLITQPIVLFHYFVSFFIPYNLSADTDWHLVSGLGDWRVYVGVLFVLGMLFAAFKTWKIEKTRPISFGILWFFITLAPTSSIIPLAEVLNDHRMFFPFLGLMISVVWTLYLLFLKYKDVFISSFLRRNLFVLGISSIFIAHIIGTSVRTDVWDNGNSLWLDVSIKSPKNGRGLMNYGLRLMNEGKTDSAMVVYDKALLYTPNYSYLHTNRAIALNKLGRTQEAEESYKKAIDCNYDLNNTYYFYGIFLREKNRNQEAISAFEKSKYYASDYIYARYALMELYEKEFEWEKLSNLCDETLQLFPNEKTALFYKERCKGKKSKVETMEEIVKKDPSTDNLINLSLTYYNAQLFTKMIDVCNQILKKEPNNIIALNNLISAYNSVGEFDKSISIGEKALLLDPNNQLLQNNVQLAKNRKEIRKTDFTGKTVDELINLSLTYYYEKMYDECILACKAALKQNPNSAIAWNNICSSYNALGKWDDAINAGNNALRIDPKFELAKNNVKLAKQNKSKQ